MNFNGQSPNADLEEVEIKVQNIDPVSAGNTNFDGVLTINGVPVVAGSTPQPWPGDFDVVGNVNATQFKPLGGTTTMFLKGDGSLDLNTYVKTTGDTMTGSLTAPLLIKTGATNIEYLMGDGSTLTQSATSGNSNFYLYDGTNSVSDITPVSGELIINSLVNTTASIVYISHVTRDNIDVEIFWKFINTLTELYIQDQSLSTNYIQYNITSAPTISVGNKIAIPVAVVNSGGTGSTTFGSGHNILVSYFTNNLEVDTRLSGLENKTQNIGVTVPSVTNFSGALQVNGFGVAPLPVGINYSDYPFWNSNTLAWDIGNTKIHLGANAGQTTQGTGAVAIGNTAGQNTQGINSIAIGNSAGMTGQKDTAVAIGFQAGLTTQGIDAVAIGNQAGMTGQAENAIAMGFQAGMTTQGNNAVAIGVVAGTNTQGVNGLAIGTYAGNNTQGSNAISIGTYAGMTTQGFGSVAIGLTAGSTTQGAGSVAIGNSAGNSNQRINAVAIGVLAGNSTQGTGSVAIGSNAGQTNQAANSIVISATGVINNIVAGTCKIAPIRRTGPVAATGAIMYVIATNELVVDTNKTFVIDHPLDKNKYLVHACLEGPESGVYYRGIGEIKHTIGPTCYGPTCILGTNESAGPAPPTGPNWCVVNLPDYVDKIATDFTVQVTQMFNHEAGPEYNLPTSFIVTDVFNNSFTVFGGKSTFYWHVHGKRAHVNVEPDKDSVKVKGDGPYKYVI